MDYRDNRQRWAESHQVVHFYAGQWCTFTPALTSLAALLSFAEREMGLQGAIRGKPIRTAQSSDKAGLPATTRSIGQFHTHGAE